MACAGAFSGADQVDQATRRVLLFGFLDWTKIPSASRARRVGALHGIGNVLVVALFSVSWLMRGAPDASPGAAALILSFAGGGLSMITGWLGGELVDRLGVGVDDGAHVNAPSSLSGRPAGGTVAGSSR